MPMAAKHLVLAAMLGGFVLVALVAPPPAHAQSSTTGAIGRNPNFHNPTRRYVAAFGRIGARLTF